MQMTRRTFSLAAIGAGLAPGLIHAQSDERQGLRRARGQRHLVIGRPSALGFLDSIDVFDPAGASVGQFETPEGVLSARASPDSSRVNLSYLAGAGQLDLGAMELWDLNVTGQDQGALLFPAPAVTGVASSGPAHMVLATMYFGGVYLYDIAAAEATDITRWVVGPGQPLIPASPTFGPGGNLVGLWTGDNVHLLDIRDPEQTVVLNGHDDDLYSTGFAITEDEEWVSYTTYDPADGMGQVIWQHVETGDVDVVVDGSAWSVAEVIPGDPDHFLLFHDGEVERRAFADPTATGDVLGRIGAEPSSWTHGSKDGRHRVLGSREDVDSPMEWHWLNLAAGTVTALPELQGLDCRGISCWEQDPRYLTFAGTFDPITFDLERAPVCGLDLEVGETFVLLDEAQIDIAANHSTSGDGRLAIVASGMDATGGGAWLLDLANRTVEAFPEGSSGGAISPDGSVAAVSVPARGSGTEVMLFDPASPADQESLGAGEVLTWS